MKRKKRKVREKKAKRLPISAATVKRLAYECEDMAAADTRVNLPAPLAQYIERSGRLTAAWRRGQLLRDLKECAAGIMTVTQTATKLGFDTGQQLRALLDTDVEARDVWEQQRIHTIAAGKKALVESAKKGNQAAIRAVEICLRDEGEISAAKAVDYGRLSVPQMADIFSVQRQTIYDWYTEHSLPRNADGSFDLRTAIRWYEQYTLKKLRGKDILADADPLRSMKAQQLALDLEKQKGRLLARDAVIAGQVARLDTMVRSLERLCREVPTMIVNQPKERIKDILDGWRREVIVQQRVVPEELELSTEAAELLGRVFEVLETTNKHE